jgi:hypothetical protein
LEFSCILNVNFLYTCNYNILELKRQVHGYWWFLTDVGVEVDFRPTLGQALLLLTNNNIASNQIPKVHNAAQHHTLAFLFTLNNVPNNIFTANLHASDCAIAKHNISPFSVPCIFLSSRVTQRTSYTEPHRRFHAIASTFNPVPSEYPDTNSAHASIISDFVSNLHLHLIIFCFLLSDRRLPKWRDQIGAFHRGRPGRGSSEESLLGRRMPSTALLFWC